MVWYKYQRSHQFLSWSARYNPQSRKRDAGSIRGRKIEEKDTPHVSKLKTLEPRVFTAKVEVEGLIVDNGTGVVLAIVNVRASAVPTMFE